jgi:hypothetical protein
MRILLTHPPLMPADVVLPPLGLCTLASWLLSLRHEVRILDLDLEICARESAEPEVYVKILRQALTEFLP